MNDLVSRQAILALPRRITRTLGGVIVEESVDIEDIKKLPPAQPDHHIAEVSKKVDADLISRQEAIDSIFKILDRPNHADFLYTDEIYKVLNALPSAQPEVRTQMSSADCISRKAAIEALYKKAFRLTVAEEYCHEDHVAWSAYAVYRDVMEGALLELPSAQAERREA